MNKTLQNLINLNNIGIKLGIALLILVLSVLQIAGRGLNLSHEFVGGTIIDVTKSDPAKAAMYSGEFPGIKVIEESKLTTKDSVIDRLYISGLTPGLQNDILKKYPEVQFSSVESDLPLNTRNIVIGSILLILAVTLVVEAYYRKSINFSQKTSLAVSMIEVVLLTEVYILAVLSLFRISIDSFTISSFLASTILGLILVCSLVIKAVGQEGDDKIKNFAKFFVDKLKLSTETYIYILTLTTIFCLPFLGIESLRNEIIILVVSIWLNYIFSIIFIPSLLGYRENIFSKLKKKK